MKKLSIFAITIYQAFIVIPLKSILGVNNCCRFEETCSNYAKRVFKEQGVVKGGYLSAIRLLKCQPFYTESI